MKSKQWFDDSAFYQNIEKKLVKELKLTKKQIEYLPTELEFIDYLLIGIQDYFATYKIDDKAYGQNMIKNFICRQLIKKATDAERNKKRKSKHRKKIIIVDGLEFESDGSELKGNLIRETQWTVLTQTLKGTSKELTPGEEIIKLKDRIMDIENKNRKYDKRLFIKAKEIYISNKGRKPRVTQAEALVMANDKLGTYANEKLRSKDGFDTELLCEMEISFRKQFKGIQDL